MWKRRWRERVKWKDQGCRLRENVKKEVKGDGEGLGSRGVDLEKMWKKRWRERVEWEDQGCRLRENEKKEVKGEDEVRGSRV